MGAFAVAFMAVAGCGDSAVETNDTEEPEPEPTLCIPGEERGCYGGPDGTEGVGVCAAGVETCRVDGSGFEACIGQVGPLAEDCATVLDDDCDGAANEDYGQRGGDAALLRRAGAHAGHWALRGGRTDV